MSLTLSYVCALGCWEEPSLSPGAGQDHQGIYLHKGKQSNIKLKHW